MKNQLSHNPVSLRWVTHFATRAASLIFLALSVSALTAQDIGDEWTGRRGDANPNLTYTAMVTTATGRMIAVGSFGQLMYSDNGGSHWDFSRIEVGGRGVIGNITDIKEFSIGNTGSRRLIATAVHLTSGGPLGFVGRTVLYHSSNNGTTWTEQPFPYNDVELGGGLNYAGVVLTGLHVSPSGEILAYGTTNVARSPFLVWSIGGLIYRSVDGVNWNLARFAYGPLYHMAGAGGRVIAVGANTVLDSADGAGWNGYFLDRAAVMDGGQLMSYEDADRVRLYDVVEQGGNFTAYGIIHKRIGPIIETAAIARQFTLTSSAPFGPGRIWDVHNQSTDPGNFVPTGGELLGIGLGGVRASSNNGETFSVRNTSPRPRGRSYTKSGSNITVVNSSSEVWKSTSSGATWSKVWDVPEIPNINVLGVFFGRLYGVSYYGGSNGIYVSSDNGETWTQISTVTGSVIRQVGNRLIMPKGPASAVRISDDEGATWQDRTVASTTAAGNHIALTPTGRLVMAASGKSVSNQGVFYVSDDDGETWQPRVLQGLQWGEVPSMIFCTAEGTLMSVTNTSATFNPRIYRSEDDGETWTHSDVFRSTPGLDPISNAPGQTVITGRLMRQGPSGRILLLGDEDEVLSSDDDGVTWTVRLNLDTPLVGSWLDWQIEGLVWAGDRWVAISSRNNDRGQKRYFSMVSGDDGETWREAPIQLNLAGTGLFDLQVGLDGRLIATGSNGAVYTTDLPELPTPESPGLQVTEGSPIDVTIERPPFPGAVSATFRTVNGVALGGIDYTPAEGMLDWADGDETPRVVTITTLDNTLMQSPRSFTLAMEFGNDDLGGSSEIPIEVLDNDGAGFPGLRIIGGPVLYTSESGSSANFSVALQTPPVKNVTVNVSGWNMAEARVSKSKLIFTPENWNQEQTVRVTGLDDWVDDGDRAHTFVMTAVTRDANYSGLREELPAVNRDNDLPAAGTELRVGQLLDLPLDGFGDVIRVRGLPRGVRWDRTLGTLVGRVTAPRTYRLTLTVLEPGGGRVTFRVPLSIQPLPAYAVGTFSGSVDREATLNDGLGGIVQFSVRGSGASSGFVRLGGKRYAWRGTVTVPAVGPPSLVQTINRRGMDPLTFTTEFQQNQLLVGTLEEPSVATAAVNGWQHTWSRRNRVPEMMTGQFNTLLTLGAPSTGAPWIADPDVPQGSGHARVLVAPTGTVRWLGQLGDGTKLVGAVPLGPDGELRHWQTLYRNTGSVLFQGGINTSDELDGTGDWVKQIPQPSRTRDYVDGFGLDSRGPVGLILTGGRWTRPARGENLLDILGIDEIAENLGFAFTEGGISASATDPDVLATLDARNRIAPSATNPAAVAAKLNPATGILTGVLRPVDDNPEKPGSNLVRTTKYIGIWMPRLNRAEAAFQLPQLADPGTTTARTSPILSGKVVVLPRNE